jgi:hypothetical protein
MIANAQNLAAHPPNSPALPSGFIWIWYPFEAGVVLREGAKGIADVAKGLLLPWPSINKPA